MKEYREKLKEIEAIDTFELTSRGLVKQSKQELDELYNDVEKAVERLQRLKITISMIYMSRKEL